MQPAPPKTPPKALVDLCASCSRPPPSITSTVKPSVSWRRRSKESCTSTIKRSVGCFPHSTTPTPLAQFAVGLVFDRSNLRWAFAAAVLAWSVAAGLTSLAGSFATLLLFRLLLGIAESANWPAAMRICGAGAPPKDRPLGNGIFHQRHQYRRAHRTLAHPGYDRLDRLAVDIRGRGVARRRLAAAMDCQYRAIRGLAGVWISSAPSRRSLQTYRRDRAQRPFLASFGRHHSS